MEQTTHNNNLFMFMALLFFPLLLLIKLRKRAGNINNGVKLPPSPTQLPVIGSLHHLAGNPFVHRALADLARELDTPLMYLKLGEVPVVVATSPNAAHEIMRTHDVTFATRPWSSTMKILMADGYGLGFAPYGDHWRQLRKISVLELLSARRVQSFRHVREEEAAGLVAAVAATPAGEPANLSELVAETIADSTVRALIGDRFGRREEFLKTIEEESKLTSGFNLADLFPSSWLVSLLSDTARRSHAMHQKSMELMEHAIKQHEEARATMAASGKVAEEGDLVDVLLRIQREGGINVPLTNGTIKALIFPRVTEDDLGEMKYLKLVIKETLRLHPAAPLLIPREARETCKVLGYDVPKGTRVLVNAWAIGRDPKYWDDAEEFKPERFEICPGILFAQANMELVEAGLEPTELDMIEQMGLTIKRKNDLRLYPIVRVPPPQFMP
ncbi:hypothetical protein HU200_031004 [Digitaria exilis]|uniref:Cytochrome P450 n=1 Tax=Digitaria exilis TaxID=1010633 RepID=A0A835BWA9_9POAL|nr:hypothetical protein HU200_031004 [Digitaria exilis]